MLAASTYDPWWPRIAEDFVTRLETSMQELDVVAAVTGNPTTTDGARTALVRWLVASEKILRGARDASVGGNAGVPGARASLITVTNELLEARSDRRSRHDALILGGGVAIIVTTLAAHWS